ncbi:MULTISPECIES: hypothetical protein [Streptomyces]|uniref:hypothetical protein n=1 Tax=Streptomyces TaxID=1883 RepID=UPI00345C06F1
MFFAARIAGRLGADFHIGLAAEHTQRVSDVIIPKPGPKPAPNPRLAILVGAHVTDQDT